MVSIQVLKIVDILSLTKIIENRKLWLISFLKCQLNTPKFLEKSRTCDMIDHCIVVCAVVVICAVVVVLTCVM